MWIKSGFDQKKTARFASAEFLSRAGPTLRSIEETTSTGSTVRSRHQDQSPARVSSQSTVSAHIYAPAKGEMGFPHISGVNGHFGKECKKNT